MRACIVGGGLAGSLLAWRLAGLSSRDWEIDLVLGDSGRADATSASGGAVRAYERHPEQRRLAIASLTELLASPTLRHWSEYTEVGSVYLRDITAGVDAEIADVESALPGSARLLTPAELTGLGWAGLPEDVVGVGERRAGYTSADRLRQSALADGSVGRRVTMTEAAIGAITPDRAGFVKCAVAGRVREYDLVVLAAGAWTGALLRACGLPAEGYRTKSIQYSVYRADGWRPTPFVDEVTGLYGRPTAEGLLLGLPTDEWEVDPNRPPMTPALHDSAARLASGRFPALRLGSVTRRVGSADCYAGEPVLALRPVRDTDQLFTFTGGAGGSVKTALAASHRAATQLAESGPSAVLTSPGHRKGQ